MVLSDLLGYAKHMILDRLVDFVIRLHFACSSLLHQLQVRRWATICRLVPWPRYV